MTRVNLRQATRDDVVALYGAPPRHTIQGIVGEVDGKVIGIGALVYQHGSPPMIMSYIPEPGRKYKVAMHRAARLLMERAERQGHRMVFALQDKTEATSSRWLRRLGFEPLEGDMWIWRRLSHT